MTPTASDVRRTLALLGDSPAAIAETLANKGVTGERKLRNSCPLAQYLRAEYGCSVAVSFYAAVVNSTRCELTPEQAVFVLRFDHGMYPELIAGMYPELIA